MVMVPQKEPRVLVGHVSKKPKDLNVCESEDGGRWEGGGVYDTLMELDTL